MRDTQLVRNPNEIKGGEKVKAHVTFDDKTGAATDNAESRKFYALVKESTRKLYSVKKKRR